MRILGISILVLIALTQVSCGTSFEGELEFAGCVRSVCFKGSKPDKHLSERRVGHGYITTASGTTVRLNLYESVKEYNYE